MRVCGCCGADEDDEEEGKLPGIKTHTFDGMDVRPPVLPGAGQAACFVDA